MNTHRINKPVLCLLVCLATIFSAGAIEIVSVNSNGEQANAACDNPSISGDGMLVSFSSAATNLVPDDANGATDIFVRDRRNRMTKRISVDSNGNETGGAGGESDISANGRYVVFTSGATDLVSGDANSASDVFRHDLITGETIRVSLDASGNEIMQGAFGGKISADGSIVAFGSVSPDLAPGDTNGVADVFIKELATGAITRVTRDESGNEFTGAVTNFSLSDNGAALAFVTRIGFYDRIFVWLKSTGTVKLLPSEFRESMADPAISANGRYVAFRSVVSPHHYVAAVDTVTFARTSITTDAIGLPGYGIVSGVSISGDGQEVAFSSDAQSLTLSDINRDPDVFVRNISTRLLDLVSHLGDETRSSGDARSPVISANGAYTAFVSYGSFGMTFPGPASRILIRESRPERRMRLTLADRIDRRGTRKYALDLSDGRTHSFYFRVENNSTRREKPILIGNALRKPLLKVKAISYSREGRRNVTAGIIRGSKTMGYMKPEVRFSIRVFLKRRQGRSGSQRLYYRLEGSERKFRTPRVTLDLQARG